MPNRPRAAQQPEGRAMRGMLDTDVRTNRSLQSESVHFIINMGCYKQHSRGFMDTAPKAPQCWEENSLCIKMKICRADKPTDDVTTKLPSFSIISCVIPLRQKAKEEAKRQTVLSISLS